MTLETKPFNIQDYLKTPEEQAAYLQVALESGDLEDIAMAIGDISCALKFDYPVKLTPDEGTVLVTFPDVPEAITFGNDEGEALLYAVEALETALSFYVEERKPLPIPSKPAAGQKTVCPGAPESVKLGVYQAMMEQGIRNLP